MRQIKLNTNFSIVIPTYHEAENIPLLIKKLSHVNFYEKKFEVLLIDDNSQDNTREVVSLLANKYSWLKLITRKGKRNLSASILEGFQQASYPIVITMDADLSHPPEKINHLIDALLENNVDMVIGSRYITGGSVDPAWPLTRKIFSQVSAWIARVLFISAVKDPLSGFIAIKKSTVLSGRPLNTIGWKIGLEIIIKCGCKNIKEIPIHFSERINGKSKLTMKIALSYFYHLTRLLCYKIGMK